MNRLVSYLFLCSLLLSAAQLLDVDALTTCDRIHQMTNASTDSMKWSSFVSNFVSANATWTIAKASKSVVIQGQSSIASNWIEILQQIPNLRIRMMALLCNETTAMALFRSSGHYHNDAKRSFDVLGMSFYHFSVDSQLIDWIDISDTTGIQLQVLDNDANPSNRVEL